MWPARISSARFLTGQGRQLDPDLLLVGVELEGLLVGPSRARRIALGQARAPEVVVIAGQAGIELVHFLELLHGLRRVSLAQVGETQEHPGLDPPGVRGDQRRELGDRLVGRALLEIEIGEGHDDLRRLGVERERRLQDRDRLLVSPFAAIDLRQHHCRGDLARLLLENRLEQRHRLGVALAIQGETGELEARGREAIVHLEGAPVLRLRLLRLLLQDVSAAEQRPRLDILAVRRDHLLEEGDRLVQLPLPDERRDLRRQGRRVSGIGKQHRLVLPERRVGLAIQVVDWPSAM